MRITLGAFFLLLVSSPLFAAEASGKEFKEKEIPFTNYKAVTKEPSITNFNFSQGKKLNFTIKMDGKDFDENKSQGCYLVSPWFDLERQLLKTEKGFEVRDRMELKKTVSAEEIKTNQEYKYFLQALNHCIQAQKVSFKNLDTSRSLKQRLARYTLADIHALRDIPGRDGAANALKIKMITDQLLEADSSNKELLVERVKALSLIGLYSDKSLNSTLLSTTDSILDKVLAQDPNYAPALIQKSYNLGRKKELVLAKTYFLKAHSNEKARTHELFILGGWLSKQMKINSAALHFYTQSLAVAKSDFEKSLSYKRLAYISDDLLEPKKAAEYFHKALEYAPSDIDLMTDIVSFSVDVKNFDQAIQVGEKLLTLEDSNQTRRNLADAYAGKADLEMEGPQTNEKIQKARNLVTRGLKWDAKNSLCTQALERFNQSLANLSKEVSPPSKEPEPARQPAAAPVSVK